MGALDSIPSKRMQMVASTALALLLIVSTATAGLVALTSTSAAAGSNPIKFVYVSSTTDNVTFVREDGTKVGTNVSADIIGPMADLDSDGALEAPIVTSQSEIYLVDPNNETQFVANSTYNSKTKLSVGDWTGDGTPEVLYANTSDNNYLYYANLTGTPTRITSVAADAVLGAKDFNGDGSQDLVFIGTSQNLKYYNGSTVTDTGYGNFGINDGLGAGAPADFRRNGELWVPAVDGSGYPELVNASGNVDQITSDSMDKTPVAGVDWKGDSRLEILHLKNGNVKYTYLNGTTQTLSDASGSNIGALGSAGVAGVINDTGLTLNLDAKATGSQNVTVNATTNEDLTELNVTLSGPENATLTLADGDFQETSTDPYVYTATYNGSTDGNYNITLQHAKSADGDTLNDGSSDTVTADDLSPTVEQVTVSDGDENDLVGPNEQISANITVSGDVDSISADMTPFGAGTPSTNVNLDGGTTTVQLNGTANDSDAAADGNYSVTATASDDEGNTDTGTSSTLTLDMTAPTVDAGNNKSTEVGTEVSFSGSASDTHAIERYKWSFGTGDTAIGDSVSYTYDQSGTYTVTLEVTDAAGNTGLDTLSVTVNEESTAGDGDSTSSDDDDNFVPTPTPTSTPTPTPSPTPIQTEESAETATTTEISTETMTSTETTRPPETSTETVTPTETPTPRPEQTETPTSTPSDTFDLSGTEVPVGIVGVLSALLLLALGMLSRVREE